MAAIHTSPLDRLKKDCFYYYLLKDYLDERSERFAKVRCLSNTWRVFIDGYWNLDHGHWEVRLVIRLSSHHEYLDISHEIPTTDGKLMLRLESTA